MNDLIVNFYFGLFVKDYITTKNMGVLKRYRTNNAALLEGFTFPLFIIMLKKCSH